MAVMEMAGAVGVVEEKNPFSRCVSAVVKTQLFSAF